MKIFALAPITLIILMIAFGCKKNDANADTNGFKKLIVGKWQHTADSSIYYENDVIIDRQGTIITFVNEISYFEDGSFTTTRNGNYNYTIDDKALNYKYPPDIIQYNTSRFEIKKLTATDLVLGVAAIGSKKNLSAWHYRYYRRL